ncbi:MAG TPA: zeta toxin family protein, partial [Candidatus Sumerlaeota bacterium]|nr:zeta toxin family protein [Candidatus Sumerlaeota bacterium]
MQRMLMGIAGGTGSGKTTVAKMIRRQISEEEVVIISQDMYYLDHSDLPVEEREKINYDHPDA